MKHTKGPWKVEFDQKLEEYSVNGPSETVEARYDKKADAALIAAAPEMLEALEYLLSRCDRIVHYNGDKDPRKLAKAVIAKAKGGAE